MSSKRYLRSIKEIARFSDLESWDDLFAYCTQCGRIGSLDRYALEGKYGKHATLHSLKRNYAALFADRGK
ncbi:hypothetical protein J2X72_005170 [Phyllobacterium sp. 1468]|nr:hypothetical protein [Phyllobacterium sp. 1468]